MAKHDIPVMILKSERDPVAKFVPRIYEGDHIDIIDVTNEKEDNFFREHVYHMVHPKTTSKVIDAFIQHIEAKQIQPLAESAFADPMPE